MKLNEITEEGTCQNHVFQFNQQLNDWEKTQEEVIYNQHKKGTVYQFADDLCIFARNYTIL